MKIRIQILFIVLLVICSLKTSAQKFDYIDTKGYTIHSLLKDSRGILWLGTNDGIMTYAQLLSQTPNGFIRNPQLKGIIVKIEEDKMGRLLLRAQSNKYMIYNPKDNRLIKDVDIYLNQAGVPIEYDFCISIDENGNYWLGGKRELYLFDPQTRKHRHVSLPKKGGNIVSICSKRNKEAVVVCEHEVYLVNKKTLRATYLCHSPETYNYQYFFLQADSKGNIWLASPAKLHRFDMRTKQWRDYNQTMFDITEAFLMRDDQLLVPTSNTGVFIFDKNGNEMKHLLPSPLTGLINKHLLNCYYDADNENIWVIYHKQGLGMAYYSNKNYRLRPLPSLKDQMTNDIIALAESSSHELWMGTEDNGAYKIASNSIQDDKILTNQQPNSTVVSLLCDSKGKVWTGLYRFGLKCSDGSTYFDGYSPYSLVEGPDGCIYASLMRLGLWKINPATHQTSLVEDENLWLMQCVRQGDWLYTASARFIHCINMRTGKKRHIPGAVFKNSNFSAGTKALCIDRRGWLWIVNYNSYSDVEIFDTKHNRFFTINTLNKYVLNSVVEDNDGNMWFGTTNGIVRLKVEDERKRKFSCYSYHIGTQKNQYFNERCVLRLSDGRLLFGATDGYMLFNPREITQLRSDISKSNLVFTALRINSQYVNPSVPDDKDAICKSDFSFVKVLDLPYNKNNIVLEFCPRNAMHNSFSNYYYKVEGLSKEWMSLNNYQILLSNLKPGSYKIIIREHPNQLSTENIEYEALNITIHPPFWLSTWAYLIYIILILGAAYMIYRYRTNRRRYLEKMNMMRVEAKHRQEMNDMKLQFFTNVSHDLRTPLTLIITPLEDLLSKVSDTSKKEILNTMLRNARRLFFLVNQILDIRALDVSAVKVVTSQQDVIELLEHEYQAFLPIANSRKMQFKFEADIKHLLIETDVDKVTKIVENLLSNAFKYTPDGETIILSAHYAQNLLHISVSDTGKGISDQEKKLIFEPFFLGQEINRSESSGIGLSIVKQFTEQLGGKVEVCDNEPRGSVFSIELPAIVKSEVKEETIMRASSIDDTIELSKVDSTASSPHTAKKEKSKEKALLLVEDNIDLLQYLSTSLGETYNIFQATDGRQALEILKATDIDLIVSDVMMDGMDGMTLCKEVKGHIETSHIPLILLTAKSLEQDELAGLQMGANDYVTKPFSMEILRLRIKSQLERVGNAQKAFKEKVEVNPSEVTITTLDQQLLSDCIAFVERNIDKAGLSPEELALGVNLSRTTLYKKLRSITGDTPVEFIRILRLKRAKQLLEQDHLYVAEVAGRVGFNNPKTFSKYFHEEFGVYPSEIAQKAQ